MHFETKFLEQRLQTLDTQPVSVGEYMQIGLLLKILETLNNIRKEMEEQRGK